MDTVPEVGEIMEIPLRNGTVRFVRIVRKNSDARDWRRCSVCKQSFGYGPFGQHMVTRALVCALDCTKER